MMEVLVCLLIKSLMVKLYKYLGGATFCAIASLKILDSFNLIKNRTQLIKWLLDR